MYVVASAEQPPPDPCAADSLQSCKLINGCSWCLPLNTAPFADDNQCLPWRNCGGPSRLCELRTNRSLCEDNPPSANPSSSDRPCAWCATENRCVNLTGDPPPAHPPAAAGGAPPGQCVGCDGAFDSGAAVDACRVCGGGCVGAYLAAADPARCPCVGCDGAPFSGAVVDRCGVCGGGNRSCAGAGGFTEEQSLGIALAVSGNVLISASLSLQKHAHNLNTEQAGARERTQARANASARERKRARRQARARARIVCVGWVVLL
jgi:hypothetical protein